MHEQESLLLSRGSLETCPPELRQSLTYMLHLRSRWNPEGRAKLIVPTTWMVGSCHFGARNVAAPYKKFLALANVKCGIECVAAHRCPFRSVRFESVTTASLAVPDEELPQDIVSQLLTNFGMDSCLPTFVSRAFEGIPCTNPRRYAHLRFLQRSSDRKPSSVPATSLAQSQSTLRRIDFALFSEHDTRCLLLGMKAQPPFSFTTHSGRLALASIPEELSSHGQFYLTLLTSLMQGRPTETTTECFPEWLVLFGLAYDAYHVRVIAYLPRRRKLDVIDCVPYIVDELPLRSGPVPGCELVLERFRLLLALTTLRRHVLHLSKSLFTVFDPCDGIGQTNNPSHSSRERRNSDGFESPSNCLSSLCSSEYSTCLSSVHTRGNREEESSSSCRSFASSFCSSCSSLLGCDHTSDSFSSDSKYNYMEPSTTTVSQEQHEVGVAYSNSLTESKRRAIIAWAREVIPTEHPVKDTYKMVVHPGFADSHIDIIDSTDLHC